MDQLRRSLAPTTKLDMSVRFEGYGWHGPFSVVSAPQRSLGYAFVALPRMRSRGTPNAVRSPFSATC